MKINVQAIKDDAVEGRIYIELVPNENFVRGLDFYQYMIVNVSGVGLSSQPTLWRTNSLDTYGGTYSSVKAEKFIELNGILEENWKAPFNKAILYAYAEETYEWFENNPTYDNGELVVFKGTIDILKKNRSMKVIKDFICMSFVLMLIITGCYEDKGSYNYSEWTGIDSVTGVEIPGSSYGRISLSEGELFRDRS